jgi:hypothetical protein
MLYCARYIEVDTEHERNKVDDNWGGGLGWWLWFRKNVPFVLITFPLKTKFFTSSMPFMDSWLKWHASGPHTIGGFLGRPPTTPRALLLLPPPLLSMGAEETGYSYSTPSGCGGCVIVVGVVDSVSVVAVAMHRRS